MSTELEQLRRRLYVAGAGEADLRRYRHALAETATPAVRPPVPAPSAGGRGSSAARGVLRRAALALAVAGLAVLAAVLGGATHRPVAAEATAIRPPIRVDSTTRGLTGDAAVQRLIDRVFAEPAGAADAGARMDARIGRAVLPSAPRVLAASAGGRSDEGSVTVLPPTGSVVVQRRDTVLLSVLTREPADPVWQVLGWRRGEPHRPHPVLVVQPRAGGADRVSIAVLRVPEQLTVTSITVAVDPATPFRYRLEHYAGSASAGASAPAAAGTGAVGSRS